MANRDSTPNTFIFRGTLKAYLQRQIISYTKGLKKKCSELNSLELEEHEKRYQRASKELYRTLVNKKIDYNKLNMYQTEKSIIRSSHKFYELGENPSKVVACQLKTEKCKRIVNEIEITPGKISNKPTEMNSAFQKYYSDLYTAQSNDDTSIIDTLLFQLNLLCLSNEDR